ncbi:unnamed protein product [Cuscuta europaea]|uniref:Uncharacterized protein n=1 Tax=Cuscuta europaea TaxID=41803 RepID=A0A9P0YTC8_CUSEU|nr:unnamed protein product [Cuscuta europaea]
MDLESSFVTLYEDIGPCNECMDELMVPGTEVEPGDEYGKGLMDLVVPYNEVESDEDDDQGPMDLVISDSKQESDEDDDQGPMELVVSKSEQEEGGERPKEVVVPDSEEQKEKIHKEVKMHSLRSLHLETFLKIILPGWESRMWDVDV